MHHIASRVALDTATQSLLAAATDLDDAALTALGSELQAVAGLLDREPGLRRSLSEATTDLDARAALISRLLTGKVGAPALAVVDNVVRQPWSTGGDLREGIERLGRTAMFQRAERSGELDEVEDQLFRFSRIADASPELSVILDDPTVAPEARAGLVERVLGGRALPLTIELVSGLARHTGGRSFSFGLRGLVDQAAERTDKVVAIVQSAVALSDEQFGRLTAALKKIYARDVAVHVEVDTGLQGGMRIQVGDEVIDGSVSGRLDSLRRALAG